MKKITAKFNSQCSETGVKIKKGDSMFYDYSTKQCFAVTSPKAKSMEESNDDGNLVQAQEDAYFDNFCSNNNI
jgi:hypothetical protein